MPSPHYRFGDYKLLPAERLLFRRGSELALTARAFELLVAFVERAGQLVAKDDLLRRVWAGVVVEENNLAVQVGTLRKLLGAEAITTIPGFGYRFALEVIDVDIGQAEPGPRGHGNLPARLPTLIGREAELAEAAAVLRAHPVLTLCGGPGLGKTRLAQELALRLRDDFADGAWWVDLTLLQGDEPVAAAVARTLGLAPCDDPLADLTRRLTSLTMLLVLDNAEHCAAEVSAFVEALAQGTARVGLLVTSQLPLHAAGERLFRLAALPVEDAVRLLAARAGSALAAGDASSQAAEICLALDGNPLAIELAASRIDALGLEGLVARLHQRLTLLGPGDALRPSRRNALAAALDWSHDLLAERERRVLRRLAVFPGSFSLEAAALVLADDALPAQRAVESVLSLVDRSLVSVERGAQRRYRLLETMRLFALDKLAAAGESELAQARFCAGLRWLFDDAYEESWRMPPPAWRARYQPEIPGLWAALAWAGEHDLVSAAALFGASAPLWTQLAEQARAQATALAARLSGELAHGAVPVPILARFWWACAQCHSVFNPGLARHAAERAAQLYAELGDTRGEYLARVEYAFNWRVDGPEARAALAQARALENPAWPAAVLERGLTTEAVLHLTAGRYDEGRRCYLAAQQVCECGDFAVGVNRALLNLADLERAAGNLDLSISLGEALHQRLKHDEASSNLSTLLCNLMAALIAAGRHEQARDVALEFQRRLGRLPLEDTAWTALDALALLQLHDGRLALAARLAGVADREFVLHGQAQRQPNEAADRAALAHLLAQQLPASEVERLHAEGQRMRLSDAIALAFELDRPVQPDAATGSMPANSRAARSSAAFKVRSST
jgi:predicted ATPase/DNA-binding winged helix-turn-helix (wHTH) protein